VKQASFLLSFIFLCLFSRSYSQIILAPDLQCVQNDPTSGNITLSWTNPPVNGCGPFVQYTIYGSPTGRNGPYSSVTSVPSQSATTFVLTAFLATSPNWYFYMEADYNCPGATVLQSDTVENKTPITPLIINVDVTAANTVIFNWEPSVSPQTQSYIVYYYLPNGNSVPLDTVYGRFNTTYTDISADPTTQSLVYTVAAVDSCGGISAFNTLPHNTIWLQASTAACQNQIDLAWNRYNNWPIGVKEYQIYARLNLGAYNLVGAVDSNTTTYAFSNFTDGDSVDIVVRAISGDDTLVVSNSNIVHLKATIVQPPSFIFMTNATVSIDNQISITWTTDPAGELTFYKIERSGNNAAYSPIDQLSAPAPPNLFESYIDSVGVLPSNNAYFYTVTAFDSCQTQYLTPPVKTICLKGELYDYYVANLTWNDFELHGATVTSYRLYRDYGTGYQLIRTFPFGVTTFSDSLQQFLYEEGTFCYRIEAVYDLNLPEANYQAVDTSWSNVLCIIHRPIIYISNAFAPNGVNNVFKPTIIFGGSKAYTLQIYNRWGGLVFESNDPATGWDGSDHGKEAQQGGYAYLIQFYANDEVKVERKGMVLLVR
jgi:gliding motility-associated-like protein